jgi:hypothetical protein
MFYLFYLLYVLDEKKELYLFCYILKIERLQF